MKIILTLLLVSQSVIGLAQLANMPVILPLRERATVMDDIFRERFTTLLPTLMQETDIDLWLIIAREYNEDPVIKTMLPSTWLSARRRTILVIHRTDQDSVEGRAVARYAVGDVFQSAWNPEEEPDQWKRLAAIVEELNPQSIGINTSALHNHADGLTHTEYEQLVKCLPAQYQARLVSAEALAVRWLETRTDRELALYEQIARIAHQIVAEGLSEQVIQPGVTTTEDVQWWYRQRVAELTLDTWFHPSVDVTRPDPDAQEAARSFSQQTQLPEDVIMPGDLVHVDFGITYLRLNTDMQQNAYVLRPGETAPPAGLVKAFTQGYRLQDILTANMQAGVTGNEALRKTREQAQAEGIVSSIYSHPLGYHGHAAGPAIGMWDNQAGDASGEHPIYDRTAYAVELNARVPIPEWGGKEIRVMLEENAVVKDNQVHYLDGRQKELYLIPRSSVNQQ